MDRTIIPNGSQEESPGAREIFRKVTAVPEITLVYATGRDVNLAKEAIASFQLPVPDYVVGDVGATIYSVSGEEWIAWPDWRKTIALDWKGLKNVDIRVILSELDDLKLQEEEKQHDYKLSYYIDLDKFSDDMIRRMDELFDKREIKSNIIWSIDEVKKVGLIDVLPLRANKLQGLMFIIEKKGYEARRTVFAGDSGNDLIAITSGLNSVLVKNASEDVKGEAVDALKKEGLESTLYIAAGDFHGMNGNYSAGVIEGLAHYFPEVESTVSAAVGK